MMIFWIICVLLLLIALSFVAMPLWRCTQKNNSVQRDHANLEIFRDQIAEMDTDLRNGLLTQEMYDQGKQELQSRVLDEVAETQGMASVLAHKRLRVLVLVLAMILPLLAVGLYWKVGNYQGVVQQAEQELKSQAENEQFQAALKELEAAVAAKPSDTEGLALLARTYSELERHDEALQLYDRLSKLLPKDAQVWADYADAMATSSGHRLAGEPTRLLAKALALDPANFKALALSGSAAMERHDYANTIRHWEKLLKMIPKENENAKLVENGIQQARALLAQNSGGKQQSAGGAQQGGKEAISGTVAISDELKLKASPEDTLFVLVRAAEGPRMPLAIVRKQVKDLPLKFTLDDSTAMSAQMKLSNFDEVIVLARISKTGNAVSQPGDLYGMSATIKPGSKGVKLLIDKINP